MITREKIRSWGPWLAVVGAMLAVGLVAGAPPGEGPPLDPTSTGPVGTKGLVDTLRLLGADVSVQSETPGPSATTALLLVDGLDEAGRAELIVGVGGEARDGLAPIRIRVVRRRGRRCGRGRTRIQVKVRTPRRVRKSVKPFTPKFSQVLC